MPAEMYDCIVIGTGGVGSSTLYHLASRDKSVLGIDQYEPGHNQGSSHGKTRLIRKAYFEHSDYVPLVKQSYLHWSHLEELSNEKLFERTGLLTIGPESGELVTGVLKSAEDHALTIEVLSAAESESRWPGMKVPKGSITVYEPDAGLLHVENCVITQAKLAEAFGAEILSNTFVNGWSCENNVVKVRTEKGQFIGKNLIITAGAWSDSFLKDINLQLQIKRKHLHWFKTETLDYQSVNGCPGVICETPNGYFYGFPQLDDLGVKVAEHTEGTIVQTPTNDDKSIEKTDLDRVKAFIKEYLPKVTDTPTHHEVCYYTMSPDNHFFIDKHPDYSNVAFAAGLSGHGFKFTPVIGEALSDFVFKGETPLPIEFLRWNR